MCIMNVRSCHTAGEAAHCKMPLLLRTRTTS